MMINYQVIHTTIMTLHNMSITHMLNIIMTITYSIIMIMAIQA